jgi:hypothetical protein
MHLFSSHIHMTATYLKSNNISLKLTMLKMRTQIIYCSVYFNKCLQLSGYATCLASTMRRLHALLLTGVLKTLHDLSVLLFGYKNHDFEHSGYSRSGLIWKIFSLANGLQTKKILKVFHWLEKDKGFQGVSVGGSKKWQLATLKYTLWGTNDCSTLRVKI